MKKKKINKRLKLKKISISQLDKIKGEVANFDAGTHYDFCDPDYTIICPPTKK